ncbi:MAG: hypothetical protein WD733_22470 [Bryobacterales bacterium]
MRLLGIGIVLVILVLALAVLFHKLDRLEEKIEQAHKPRLERIAAAPNPGNGIRAVR